ncbi:MAG TPA: glycosyltransferase family 2 protein [Candidatus Acidoferrales bacterium]|jgi:glycosyltransferase involved in cell wall biosynthesis|nr:glycosyltransferase family 2 protein [Candidatus Acidoferrales bacterium]
MNRLAACLITLNEEKNLPRVLASLAGIAEEIIVVDSGSADRTLEIAAAHGARVFARAWTNYSDQKNFAAAHAASDWVLSLDADEELSPALRASLLAWKQRAPDAAAYEFSRRAFYLGGWVNHSGWYPNRQVRLYRRDLARFAGALHESLQVNGKVAPLPGDLLHYTVQTPAEHSAKVDAYTDVAARQLFESGRRSWRWAMLATPPWTFFQKFFLRAGFLDGYRGWLIARMAARYTFLKYRKLGALLRSGAPQ